MWTRSGSFVPHGSIADHISFDGWPIFFPGNIDNYQAQGGAFGKRPSCNDHYYFTQMAWHYVETTNDVAILEREVEGTRLIDRLDLAFAVPLSHKDSHLVYCDDENRGVTFGFVDSMCILASYCFVLF